jgi:hypothetical protein
METKLTKKQLESVLFLTYNLLSNAGFDICIDENGDGSMKVSHRDYDIFIELKNGTDISVCSK